MFSLVLLLAESSPARAAPAASTNRKSLIIEILSSVRGRGKEDSSTSQSLARLRAKRLFGFLGHLGASTIVGPIRDKTLKLPRTMLPLCRADFGTLSPLGVTG